MLLTDLAREAISQGLLFRTWGNLSKRDGDDFLVTPSGRGYEEMQEGDLVRVHTDGSYEGTAKPSSETPMHLAIYRAFPDVQVIMHTHQPYASALSLLAEPLTLSPDEQKMLGGKTLRTSPYALPGTKKLHEGAEQTARQDTTKALLLEKHGAVVMGSSEENALEKALALEAICKKYYEEKLEKNMQISNSDVIYSVRDENGIRFYRDGVEVGEPQDSKIHHEIYNARKDVNAVIPSTDSEVARFFGKKMMPYLDDFAQIIGIKADKTYKHNAVLLENQALCLAGDLYDTKAVVHILEKNARAACIAKLAGKKPIGLAESLLMHMIYQKKYSKLK